VKILYHHRTASKDGQAVHIEELVGALRELGHEVRVVGPRPATEEAQAGMGADVAWVGRLRAALPKAVYECMELAYSWLAYRRLAKAAREFEPDFIYERYNLYLLAGLALARRRKIPLLLEVNAPLVDERSKFGGLGLPWLARWAEDRVWRGADAVLPVTRVLASMVAARGVPEARLHVIPNGINRHHFSQVPTPAEAKAALGYGDEVVLGFTGFVRDWHGVDRVVRWLAGPSAPAGARLLVVGDGPARADLERLASELGVTERVQFTGVVDRDRVPSLVAAFDIALQPAVVSYASPLKLFEYLALGKATIGPRQPNLEEILQDGENALLFDGQAQGELEHTLERLCQDPALRARIAGGAARTIEARGLTWRHNAQRVGALAQQLISAAQPAAPTAANARR
jgi:glycosyltransferase involved in cell wall biosynthesis